MRPQVAIRVEHLQLTPSVGKTRQSDLMTGFQSFREQLPETAGLRRLLLQLAGHLRGHTIQEWELLSEDQKSTFCTAVDTFRERLDLGGWMLAVRTGLPSCRSEG